MMNESTNHSMPAIEASGVLPPSLPFSEGIVAGDLIFLSGQIGNVPGSLTLANGSAEEEFQQVMENIAAVLRANGLTTRNVVKCTVMLADMADWPVFNQIYLRYFEPPYPARSAFGTSGLAFGARAEVECIAMRTATRG
jgi:2-iminobutanoate/2-iminopropanoate deaminase